MSERTLRIERHGTRGRIVMTRPAVRNAFNAALIAELRAAFIELGDDEAIRSIVLAGEGKTFSGGADITWMRDALDLDAAANRRDAETMAAMFRAIDGCPKAVIARVQGGALGGGCGLLAVADIAIAADDAVFGFTEVKLGIVPAVISPFVVAKIGSSHARALFVTGERFGAARAREIGLVHTVVAAADLDASVEAAEVELQSAGPAAVRAAKALVATIAGADEARIDAYTTQTIAERRVSAEGAEGLRAFLERRSARWNAG